MKQAVTLRALALAMGALSLIPAALAEEDEKPWSMADEVWGEAAMNASRKAVVDNHGGTPTSYFQAERFELQAFDDEDVLLLDGNAWFGNDENKLWLKTELEYLPDEGEFEEAEVQALWSHAISPYFDFQAGLRQDFEPEGRTHLVAGFQGLAPYLFETDTAAFLSDDGDLTARAEVEYELLLSQRLILQPRAELGFSAQDIPELETGSGVTSLDAGLRLRYEIKREFAPYIGVEWQKRFGDTADYIEAAGGASEGTAFVIGLRAWY
ncbi:copper resistance protein B [Henriciella aquimarina]|uniref:copper resistance protein B n=1 Tax=Henriciella aquimarina TaxID=545261 RepID=UPI001F1A4A7A|nr:copper resistance protein B [Henriciella aquimarina]